MELRLQYLPLSGYALLALPRPSVLPRRLGIHASFTPSLPEVGLLVTSRIAVPHIYVCMPTPEQMTDQESATEFARIWQAARPRAQSRVKILEETLVSALRVRLEAHQRDQAVVAAQQLAGSLGVFGFPKGSSLAKKLELGFQKDLEHDGAQLREIARDLVALMRLVNEAKGPTPVA